MVHRPRFRSHYRVDCPAGDRVTLVHEGGSIPLEGALVRRLVPFLDGEHSVDEIVRRLDGELSPVDVIFGITWLEEQGHLVEAGEEIPRGVAGLADALDLDPGEVRRRLREKSVALARVGAVSCEPLERSLRELGLRLEGEGALTVVVAEDHLHPDLADFDRHARAREAPWLLVKPVGTVLWMGPLFDPRREGCWLCLAERLQGRLRGRRPDCRAPQPAVDSTTLAGFGLAATAALEWVLRGSVPALEGALVTFDVKTFESERHVFVPVPGCPVCGPAMAGASPSPLTLSSRRKVFTPDGEGRAATPEAMLQRYGHLASPLMGIVDRVTPSREETHDLLHVYTAAYADPPAPGRSGPRPSVERRRSAGRGIVPGQARAAALCEALERHSGFFRGTESRIEASWRQLGGEAVHLNDCLLISDRQFAGREAWNRLDLPYHWLPEPFDEERTIDWTAAWSLTEERFKWLPTGYCFYDYPWPDGHGFCRGDSNGCAAGSCLEEAILQGFLEVVERDALALWWYNRAPRPGVRLDGFRQPYFTALQEWIGSLGREVWVLDLTTDLGIPVFAAISRELPSSPGDFILGAGAHLDPAVAITRAVTEVNQFLPGFLAGRRRRIVSEDPGAEAYLFPDPDVPPRDARSFEVLSRPDLREEVELCVERARGRGLEVLVVDQTREDVGLPVARVVIPGMRLFRARFAPGRLYDVPVALGWQREPIAEPDLNPVHILI
jgi:bacteriocin biosynthesis cyclodehydratase domain-containing protein